MTETQTRQVSWHEIMRAALKANDVKLVTYVPDRVLTPLIEALHADDFFTSFAATREEEAVGIVTGAWMGGMRGAVLMQTSRLRHDPERARLAGGAVPDSGADVRVRARHARRIQSRPGAWCARPCGRCSIRSRVEHHTITRLDELALHRRPLDQAGGGDAGAGRLHPVAAADRRQSVRGVSA